MASPKSAPSITEEQGLINAIRESVDNTQVVSTTLKTDERVIARVTDGIYRQPGSSLRELISNAYDADATRVVIKTDAPRFDRISVEDDGHGMTPEMLAYLLFHIGGSAKRNNIGKGLGVTDLKDPSLSPGGRKLIGKIGIGLFSVSQLTHSFQIITKIKNDPHRTIATVALKQYSDEKSNPNQDRETKFESGKVNIWREKATDVEAHGTSVVLTSIRPQARDTLRSLEIWSVIERNEDSFGAEEDSTIEPPKFHIGRIGGTGQLLKKADGKFSTVPWDETDTPEIAFRKLVQCVWDETTQSNPNPQLQRIFDYYLRMAWQLSLAIPLPYVDTHLFDMELAGLADTFILSNQPKGSAKQISFKKGQTFRKIFGLVDPQSLNQFDVFFDDLKLQRPIKYKDLPVTTHALKRPLIFLGQCEESFLKIPRELSGGSLKFEAYLFWTPKIAPTEHQGVLIRIHGSSGTLFDPTFMRYQVSEQTRLRQTICEIFVHEGLDSALNIDRESFNNAHPHAVYITKWLHSALRQLSSTQKRLAAEVRTQDRGIKQGQAASNIQRIAIDVWSQETDDAASLPPSIELNDSGQTSDSIGETYVFNRSVITSDKARPNTARAKTRDAILEEKLKAIAQVLASFGLLEILPKKKQEKLLKAIHNVLDASEE